MTVATLLLTCLVFLVVGWTGAALLRHRAFDRRDRLHRLVERRHDLAGSEDGIPDRFDAEAISRSRFSSAPSRRALVIGPILMKLNDSGTVYVPVAGNKDFELSPSTFHVNPADFEKDVERP